MKRRCRHVLAPLQRLQPFTLAVLIIVGERSHVHPCEALGMTGTICVAQVPVWFCIACPIILGLLAPFVFNLSFGAVAEAICEHYQLPQEECNDLW